MSAIGDLPCMPEDAFTEMLASLLPSFNVDCKCTYLVCRAGLLPPSTRRRARSQPSGSRLARYCQPANQPTTTTSIYACAPACHCPFLFSPYSLFLLLSDCSVGRLPDGVHAFGAHRMAVWLAGCRSSIYLQHIGYQHCRPVCAFIACLRDIAKVNVCQTVAPTVTEKLYHQPTRICVRISVLLTHHLAVC
jgi:hypothetical protein